MLPNLNGVEPKKMEGFAPLPEGEYIAKITKVEEGKSTKGNEFISFEMTITEGSFEKRKLWKRAFLNGETPEKTKTLIQMYAGLLESLGMEREQRHATNTIELLRAFADGLSVKVFVTIREYKGKLQNEVQSMEQNSVPF